MLPLELGFAGLCLVLLSFHTIRIQKKWFFFVQRTEIEQKGLFIMVWKEMGRKKDWILRFFDEFKERIVCGIHRGERELMEVKEDEKITKFGEWTKLHFL